MATPISILLDLDGTVVDSKPGIAASCRAALTTLGLDASDVDIGPLIGPPLEEVMATVLGRLGDDRVAEAVAAYRAHYGEAGYRETAVYPGVAEALDRLAAEGAALYIATSKRRVFAERILDGLGLICRFAGVHGSEADGRFDHKAELIAHVLDRHGLDAARCLMVGDRRHDAEGALANGVRPVGVLWGYGDRAELEAAGVRDLAAEPVELIPIHAAFQARLRAAAS